jgi:hypothetical protein
VLDLPKKPSKKMAKINVLPKEEEDHYWFAPTP